jgi:hypothetical protein
MGKIEIVNKVLKDLKDEVANVDEIVREFAQACEPVEVSRLFVMVDAKNGPLLRMPSVSHHDY